MTRALATTVALLAALSRASAGPAVPDPAPAATAPAASDGGEAQAAPEPDYYLSIPERIKPLAGRPAKLPISISPADKRYLHHRAPLSLRLTTTPTITLEGSSFGADGASWSAPGMPTFTIPYQASTPGPGSITCDLTFFVFSDTWGRRFHEQRTVAIEAREARGP